MEQPKPSSVSVPLKKVKRKIPIAPFVLLIPWFIGIMLFRIYPIMMSFWYSLRDFHPIMGDRGFVGLDNYRWLLFDFPLFWRSVEATFRYVVFGTPMVLASALFIAFILNFKLKGVNLFRTIYYVPSILGGNVAVSLIWIQLFGSNGPVNTIMMMMGMEPVSWLRSEAFAPFTLIFLSAWQFGSVMLIFLAALQNVSPSLYEAASIDGARKFRQFISITLPIITPVVLFNTVNVLLRHFQEFNSAFLITDRGPNDATNFLNILIYEYAFRRFEFGVASAMTWLFLAAIGILTLILFSSSKHWVHYND
ncbi:MAG: sugar ABC transporter permease [Defluviitaleaceae bacterium]|nr:sugar ABC transporter permease [Defluviitaleaceae bacterium]